MPLWLWHHIVHKIVAWPILKHDTDGAQNYLQWMVLHWEHTKEISQIFVVLPVCALHGILDIHSIHGIFYFHSSCLFTTKDLQNIAENMHYTMSHFVFWFALHILPRSCHRSFGIIIVHYKWKKKISSILLLNYLNVFQFVKYLHISLFIDGFKGVSSTTIGYFLIRQTEFGGFAH